MVGALKASHPLRLLMRRLELSRSSYYFHQGRLSQADLRASIRRIFTESRCTYGYRRIWMCLASQGIRVSEKVVRRLMSQEGLRVVVKKRRLYSSYKGEITPAPPHELNRDFQAQAPNKKWLTDITELAAGDAKVYLSPVIDCFDGLVVTWNMSLNPNARLTNGMLKAALQKLSAHQRPLLHTDRGVHYRWPSWIQLMEQAGLTRSMSPKACSPDIAACEGFFGRLKNELYYGRGWENSWLLLT